jgi:hypothetical protein
MTPWSERDAGGTADDIIPLIAGRDLLIEHLGYWPDFHDFEVLSMVLERAPWELTATNDLRATFFVFDLRKPPADAERKEGTAEMLFESIDALEISGFNHQNPILGVSITRSGSEPRFRVAWGGTALHHDVSFTCRRISVLRVVNLNPVLKPHPIT